MKLNSNLLLLVAVAVLVGGQPKLRSELTKLLPGNSPAVVVPSPDATAQTAVAPITAALSGHPQTAKIGEAYFRDVANVAKSFPEKLDSIAEIEEFLKNSGTMLQTISASSVPGLREATSTALTTMLGKDEAKKLDNAAVVSAFNAVSWGYGQAK